MSIWINALSAIVIGILFFNKSSRIFSNYYNTCWYYLLLLQELLILFIIQWLVRYLFFMKNTLLSGILKCVLGIFVLTHISMMTTFFSYIFSLYIIISAIYCFEAYTFIKSMVSYSLTFDYIIVTILIFTGLAMFFLSPSTVISSAFVIGILFLINGIGNLFIALRLTKITKEYRRYLQQFILQYHKS